jgi:hypothetical protein
MNQALYDSTVTRLYEDGVSELLACLAAYILATDHLRDGRTVDQQTLSSDIMAITDINCQPP